MYDGNFLCGYVRGEAGEPEGKDIQAYCGQAENSILPGYVGVETGQAAFGDIFAWFKRLLEWPLTELAADENSGISDELYKKVEDRILVMLQKKAEELPEEPFPIALDWFNGRRYPNTDDFRDLPFPDYRWEWMRRISTAVLCLELYVVCTV